MSVSSNAAQNTEVFHSKRGTMHLSFIFLFSFLPQAMLLQPKCLSGARRYFSPGIQRQTVNNTIDRTDDLSSGRVSWSLVSHLKSKLYCSGLSLISATFLGIIYGLWNLGHIRSSFIIKKYANSCAKTLTPKWLDSDRVMRKEPSLRVEILASEKQPEKSPLPFEYI